MKKIPLEVYFFAGGLRPMAHFLLKCENPHIFTAIRAVVDTGSPTTLIGLTDMKRMRLSKIQLDKIERTKVKEVNIGGGKVYTKTVDNAEIDLRELKVNLSINFPIGGDESINQPSLLGVDFIEKIGAKFVFNPTKKEAYFEIEE